MAGALSSRPFCGPLCVVQHHGSAAGPAASQHEQSGAGQLRGPAEQHGGVRRGALPPGRAARRAGNVFDLISSVCSLPRCCTSISQLARHRGEVINIDQVFFPALHSCPVCVCLSLSGPVQCRDRDSPASERTVPSSLPACQGASTQPRSIIQCCPTKTESTNCTQSDAETRLSYFQAGRNLMNIHRL